MTNGDTDRDAKGRFVPGNAGGPGSPYAQAVAQLRRAVYERATPERMAEVVDAMVQRAIDGDTAAARLLLERTLGPVRPTAEPVPALGFRCVAEGAAGLLDAMRQAFTSWTAGDIDSEQAGQAFALLEAMRKAHETTELEQRIQALEGQAA